MDQMKNAVSGLIKLLSPEAAIFKKFAETYDLVYFGLMHHEDNEQHMVRGVTVSTQHFDEHSSVGTVNGYDIVLLKRTDAIMQANSSRSEKYSWIIMQFDLHTSYDFPHVFIDGGHHNEIFYQTLFVKFARLMKVDKATFDDDNHAFTNKFTVYTPPDALDEAPTIVDGVVGQTLAEHFSHLDFEWFQDRLIVYSTGRQPTKHLLEHMLRAGLWLAEVLDKNGQQKISAHGSVADIPNASQTTN